MAFLLSLRRLLDMGGISHRAAKLFKKSLLFEHFPFSPKIWGAVLPTFDMQFLDQFDGQFLDEFWVKKGHLGPELTAKMSIFPAP